MRTEFTKRPDGKYNRWQKMGDVKTGITCADDYKNLGNPDYMNQKRWVITGVYDRLPRQKVH